MSASAGKVLLMPKGDYDNTVTYDVLDWVRYDNKAFVCKQTSLGHLPTDTTYWQLLVQDGTSPTTKMSYYDNGILGAHNIIKLDVDSQTLEGITYTINKTTGVITASGTSSANGSYLTLWTTTLPAGEYRKSGCPSGGSSSTYHFAGSNTGDDIGSGATFTLNADTSCAFVISIEPNQTVSLVFTPQLQLATDLDTTHRPPSMTNIELTQKKADVSAVNSALALKADTSTVNAALALKADKTELADKADTTDLDEWITGNGTTTGVVISGSPNYFTFTGIDDRNSYGYKPYIQISNGSVNMNPTAQISNLTGAETANMSITYTTNADVSSVVKLRRIK